MAGTTNLANKRILNMILFSVYFPQFNKYPEFLKDMFSLCSSIVFLKGSNIFSPSKVSTTTYGLHSSSYSAAKCWNALPVT